MKISLLNHLFHSYPSRCPYGKPHSAVYRQVAVQEVDPEIYEAWILLGYRRMGNRIYRMACPTCNACIPIRMKPSMVRYGKTQRKVRNKNSHHRVVIGKPEFTGEKLELYRKFLRSRYPLEGIPDRNAYEDFFVRTCADTWEFCYYLDERLTGVATVDRGRHILNGVYFFFDPDLGRASPGVYNFIYLTEYCKREGIPYFMTGFYIEDVSAMAYKAKFYPHELLLGGKWKRIERPHRLRSR